MITEPHVDVVFAWLPKRLWEVRGHHWYPTGVTAWLGFVRKVTTVWGEVYYTELRP